MKVVISPTLLGGAQLVHHIYKPGDGEPDPGLQAISDTLEDAKATAERMVKIHTDAKADMSRSPTANAIRAYENTAPLFDRVVARIDKVKTTTNNFIAKLELETQPKPPTDMAGIMLMMESRQRLAAMSRDERAAELAKAGVEGRDGIIEAALLGDGVLSGLTPTERSALLARYRRRRFARQLDHIDKLTRAAGTLDRAHSALKALHEDLLRGHGVDVVKAKQSADAADFATKGAA